MNHVNAKSKDIFKKMYKHKFKMFTQKFVHTCPLCVHLLALQELLQSDGSVCPQNCKDGTM